AELDIKVVGPLNGLDFFGAVSLTSGQYHDLVLGVFIDNIKLMGEGGPGQPLEFTLSGADKNQGRINLTGSLDKNWANVDLYGQISSLSPLHRDDLSLTFSGEIKAEGPITHPSVSGQINIEKGEINLVPLIKNTAVPTLAIYEGAAVILPPAAPLDIDLNITGPFHIRGLGLDSEWRGAVKVGSDSRRPTLNGAIAPIRGIFEIFAQEFQFSEGEIIFAGAHIQNPLLNLTLAKTTAAITAIVKVEGRVNAPQLTLESRPPRPPDEILAQVLFGKNISRMSRFETLQLANSLRELTMMGQGTWSPLKSVRREMGLDVLRLGGGEGVANRPSLSSDARTPMPNVSDESNLGLSVEAGRFINDDVYVALEQNATGSTAVRMEVELPSGLSLQGRSGADSSQIGLGWKRDY
ncbi:MAG: translocation/assembly module TamB domain-containing protein, partial [Candidatus Adiutrix sp.]